MPHYKLREGFVAPDVERGVIAAVVANPSLINDLGASLTDDIFYGERDVWKNVAAAVHDGVGPMVPDGWEPSTSPLSDIADLHALADMRKAADKVELAASALQAEGATAAGVAQQLLDAGAELSTAFTKKSGKAPFRGGGDVLLAELVAIEERAKGNGSGVAGIAGVPTGYATLDAVLGGLRNACLLILSGAPAVGKTTFAFAMALNAALAGFLAIYVTYENTAESLALKGLASTLVVPVTQLEKGDWDTAKLSSLPGPFHDGVENILIFEGSGPLDIGRLEQDIRAALHGSHAKGCVVFVDYLQRIAHATRMEKLHLGVSALAGQLRDMARRLDCPVVAIASQNRAAGQYGSGSGSTDLDSLKESGDLEYSADVVAFLVANEKRTVTPPARAMDLRIVKNRHGAVATIPFIFKPSIARFTEAPTGKKEKK